MKPKKFAIAGGGIAGLTTAIALNRKGIHATVYEAAPILKGAGAGLGLAANAIKAFETIGLANDVLAKGKLLSAFSIYDAKGKLITRTETETISKKYGVDNFTIHRAALHEVLIANLPPEQLQLNKRLLNFAYDGKSILLKFTDGSFEHTDYLIAADGINSPVRQRLLPAVAPRYSGYTCWRATVNNSLGELTEASEYWGVEGRFGAVPLAGNRIYWFACVNALANSAAMKAMTPEGLLQRFAGFPAPVPAILQSTPAEALLWNDIYDLPPLKQYAFKHVLLVGDAAHATTPNMGQGACQAIEDAVILAEELAGEDEPAAAFRRFEQRRLQRTQEIVRTSRLLGKLAQTENRLLAAMRNSLFRLLPKGVNERQLKKLYEVDF